VRTKVLPQEEIERIIADTSQTSGSLDAEIGRVVA